MPELLSQLGWDDAWAAAARAASRTHTAARPARVVRTDRGGCLVYTATGSHHAGFGLRLDSAPTTGDWVLVDEAGTVTTVLPRRTAVVRGAGRRDARGQILAANVDVLFVVAALSQAPNLSRLERLLAVAWESGATPVVLLTKADLSADVDSERAEVARVSAGVEVIAVSVVDGRGLREVERQLPPGRTGALIGASGTGKSTLVNSLAGHDLLATREIRDDGKGRHTTTARELVLLPWGAVLLDTPGLRGVQLWDASDGVEQVFADVALLASTCRFTDCGHRDEPGCAITAALADGKLTARRLASYQRLQREQAWLAGRYDARLRAEQRRAWKLRTREARQRAR